MKRNTKVNPRQLMAAVFVALQSPLIRRFPRALAETAGAGAWLIVPLSVLPLAAILGALRLFYRKAPPNSSFADLLVLALGNLPGRVLTGLYGLWFTAYAGFLLRSGAERFLSTVYPGAGAGVFVLSMALVCLMAALGRFASIARAAMLFQPMMVGIFLLVPVLTGQDLDFSLLRLTTEQLSFSGLGFGVLQTANLFSSVTFLAFFSDRLERSFARRDRVGLRAAGVLVLLGLMTVNCLAMFGAALTAELSFPYFMLVRDVTVLGSLERLEPILIALWVLSDFVMVSLLFSAAGKTLRFALGIREASAGEDWRKFSEGRWLIPLCAAAAAGLAMAIPSELSAFRTLSETLIPLLNAAFALILPLPVLAIGLLRKRL